MKPEDIADLKQLIEFLKENQVAEFDLDRGDVKIRLKFNQAVSPAAAPLLANVPGHLPLVVSASMPSAVAPVPSPVAPPAEPETGLHTVKSPIVGTFYESSSPGAAAFVKIGDEIENGQVLCIVEAMKLMNEIESDAAGEVVKRLVTNGQPVEYGQPLFALRLR